MPTLTIGWCKNCGHKVASHSKHPDKWLHFGIGAGYLVTVNCYGYAGSTNTLLGKAAFRQGQWKCDCEHPEPDMTKSFQKKRVAV